MKRWIALVVLLAAACSEPHTANDTRCHVSHAAKTAGEGVKTGGETALEGIKTAGRTVGGLFSGGSNGAREEAKKGGNKTSSTARSDAKDTRATAKDNPCK